MSNDALSLIKQYADQQATGNLVLKKFNGEYEDTAYVYLNKGRIYSTLINNEYPPIGARIFSSGMVDPHDFSRIMEDEGGGDANDPLVYTALLREGLFPEKSLHNYIKDEFLSAMRIVLSWTEVDFEWRAGDSTQAFMVAPIPLKAAFERVNDNIDKIAGMMEEIYIMTGEDPDDEELESEVDAENIVPYIINEPEEEDVSSEEFSFFKKVDGRNNLSSICDNFGYVITPALRNTYFLWRKGYIGVNLYGNTADSYDAELIRVYRDEESNEGTDQETETEEETTQGEPQETQEAPSEDTHALVEESYTIDEHVEAPVAPESPQGNVDFFIDDEVGEHSFDEAPQHAPVAFAETEEGEEEEENYDETDYPQDSEEEEQEASDLDHVEETVTESHVETPVEEVEHVQVEEESIEDATDDEDSDDDSQEDMTEYVQKIVGDTAELIPEGTQEVLDAEVESDEVPTHTAEEESMEALEELLNEGDTQEVQDNLFTEYTSDDDEDETDDYLKNSLLGMEKNISEIDSRLSVIKEKESTVLSRMESNETELMALQEKLAELQGSQDSLIQEATLAEKETRKLTRSKETLSRAYDAIVKSLSDS